MTDAERIDPCDIAVTLYYRPGLGFTGHWECVDHSEGGGFPWTLEAPLTPIICPCRLAVGRAEERSYTLGASRG